MPKIGNFKRQNFFDGCLTETLKTFKQQFDSLRQAKKHLRFWLKFMKKLYRKIKMSKF